MAFSQLLVLLGCPTSLIYGVLGLVLLDLLLHHFYQVNPYLVCYQDKVDKNVGFTMPPEPGYGTVVYWMFAVLLSASCGKTTDQVADLLSKTNVETRPFFVPIHRQPIYEGAAGGPFPYRTNSTNVGYASLHQRTSRTPT